MKFVRVLKWWDFQHYDPARRTPPWIKVYNDLLDIRKHPTFAALSDGAKLTLHHLRLLASTIPTNSKNEVPLIPAKWVNRDRLNMSGPPKLKELVASGFAEIVDGITSEVASRVSSKEESTSASTTPLAGASGVLSESFSRAPSLEEREKPFLPPDGDFALGVIGKTLSAVAPNMQTDEIEIAIWLRDVSPDPWWIAAALCESEKSMQAARTGAYATSTLRRMRDEGWTCEDARGYVEYRWKAAARVNA